MFENNADFDFDAELLLDQAPTKRPIDSGRSEAVKKPKIDNLPRNVVKRKFPGPAGLLPDRKDVDLTILESPNNKHRNDEIPCSQTSLSIFQGGPWLEMSRNHETLVERYNIKWIKSRAGLNQLHNQKAPFLGALIQNIECFDGKNPIVNVVLKDATGEIQGTIIHNVYEEYSNYLITGSVIVLKQFGVLTTGSNNNHYLTITQNNLVTIYAKNTSQDGDSEVRVIKVQQVPDFGQLNTNVASLDPKKNITISCSQVSVSTSEEHSEIWQNVLEGLDADSFFEDF